MQKLFRIIMLMLAIALVACGGGGGSPGADPNQSFVTTAGDAITLPVGAVRDYQISGGVPPYRISNTNQGIATGSVNDNILTIRAVSAGFATSSAISSISVIDYRGSSTAIAVTVLSNVAPLITTAPASVQLANGATGSYTISGGVAPYSVVTRDIKIVSAAIDGSTLLLKGEGFGSAVTFLRDASGQEVQITVTVGASQGLFTDAPSIVTIPNERLTYTYRISGGSAPYTAKSSDERIVRASVSGEKLVLESIGFGTAEVVISDKDASTVRTTVNVRASQTLFTTAPSPVYIVNGESRNYEITGGSQPYTATSTDLTVATATVSGSTLSIAAVGGGSTTVTVSDRDSKASPIIVNVGSSTKFFINAPDKVTLQIGSSQSYLLSGGTTPYQVSSSDPSVALVSIAGTTLMVSAIKIGDTTLQLIDANGTKLTLGVTVVTDKVIVSSDPQLRSAGLKDSAGVATNAISTSGYTTLSVTLTDPTGHGIANQLIDVSDSVPAKVIFPEGASGLTNSNGVASIKLARASLAAMGAGSLTVTYNYKVGSITTYPDGTAPPAADKVISTYVGYQLATANIGLVNLDVGASTLAAYGTRQVSVQANLNGKPTTTPVQINFTATCGQVLPVTASTNSLGIATVSYSATDIVGAAQSTQGCSGKTVEISASTIGANPLTGVLNIVGAPATNMSFVSALPERIYLANSGGATQSVVTFKLVNARGEVILGQDVILTLKTLNGGIPKASFGTVGNTSAITATTDSKGEVSVPVFSGTVPTNVLVNAALKSNTAVQTDSAALTIASGRAVQSRVSLSMEKLSIEGFNFDGDISSVTLSLADRQGNPVPDGTAVNFVTEGGVMIPPVCIVGKAVAGNSQCVVTIRSQNPRPANGRVSILAYVAGEEDFVDANANNVYDCGESFTDLGTAYRDDNENGVADVGEFSVPRAASASTCSNATVPTQTKGDGVWGAADVRMPGIIIFTTSGSVVTERSKTTSAVTFTVADGNGNSMPTGTTVTVTAVDGTSGNLLTCAVAAGGNFTIPNTLNPATTSVGLTNCASGDAIRIDVKTPKTGTVSGSIISLP